MWKRSVLIVLVLIVNHCYCQSNYEEYAEDDLTRDDRSVDEDGLSPSMRTPKLLFFKHYYTRYRPPLPYGYTPIHPQIDTYDFVVIGSGSAGSALAARLSENPGWNVLLLEVGKEAHSFTDIPAIAASFQLTDYNWGYLMEKQENMCLGMVDQRMAWPRGRALGGSSIINYMIHVRGNRKDYDRWAALGNPGWSYDDVLPYFKKLENSTVTKQDEKYRGNSGPVTVSDIPYRSPASDAFVRSAFETGHRYVDYNGKRQMGVSYVQGTLTHGRRCSGESAYLRPNRGRPNLTILTESRATELLFDGTDKPNHVTGVRYVRNRQFHTVRVRKEVIVSAGTFNSPQLLMLSGIGPAQHLQSLGIEVKKDLPVGQKLYDHLTFLGLVFVLNSTGEVTIKERYLYEPQSMLDLLSRGTGPLTSLGGVEALLYAQTEVSEDKDHYPDIELIFIGGGLHTDKGLVYRKTFRITDEVYEAFYKPFENKEAFTVLPMLVHPKSYGHLKLKSRNPYHWPKLYGNCFDHPDDMRTFIAGIRIVQRICNDAPTFKRLGCQQSTIPVPGCEAHEWDSDAYWECALRHVTATLHHQVATCKMGPDGDPQAVVDHELRVRGVGGLRVADTSVVPIPLTAHTNVPAFMIGEKAADLIRSAWISAA